MGYKFDKNTLIISSWNFLVGGDFLTFSHWSIHQEFGSCRFCGVPGANPSSIFHYHVVPFAKESLKSLTKDQRHRWGIHPRRDRMGLSQRFSRPKGDCRNQGCCRGGCFGLAKSAWGKSDANLKQHTIPSEIRVHNSLSFTYVIHSYCIINTY